jgi:hypothetical protein
VLVACMQHHSCYRTLPHPIPSWICAFPPWCDKMHPDNKWATQ